ncbi:MAG: HAMP domain-containing protein, partial [Acidobacteriota bacterium]
MMSPHLSLRARLFAGFGGLVILLVVAQLWWVRSLTRELGAEVDTVALQVGSSVAQFFTFQAQGTGGAGSERQLDIDAEGGDAVEWQSRADDEAAVWVFSQGADHAPRGAAELRIVVQDEVDRERLEALGVHGTFEDLEISTDHAQIQLRGDGDTAVLRLERPDLRADVPIPRTGVRSRVERFQERLWLGSGLILALGLVGAAVISHRISTPLAILADAAERVGEGELGIQVDAGGGGPEVRRTVAAFNGMSTRLLALDRRNRELEALRHLEEIGDVAR